MSEEIDWRYVYASVIGVAHFTEQIECQDACQVHQVANPPVGTVLILAAADGAGSAAQARIGAELACQALVTVCKNYLMAATAVDWTAETAKRLFENVQQALSQQAADAGAPLRDFACTLLGAIVASDTALFLQIGDGAIIINTTDAQYRPVFWPQSGEYVNETRFVTDSDACHHLQSTVVEEAVVEIALLTDGLQLLALDYPQQRAHVPFFRPLFQQLRNSAALECSESLQKAFEHFLASPAVNQRTHDDKTLILATRRSPVAIVVTTTSPSASASALVATVTTDSTVLETDTVATPEIPIEAPDPLSNQATAATTATIDSTDANTACSSTHTAPPILVPEKHDDEVP